MRCITYRLSVSGSSNFSERTPQSPVVVTAKDDDDDDEIRMKTVGNLVCDADLSPLWPPAVLSISSGLTSV